MEKKAFEQRDIDLERHNSKMIGSGIINETSEKLIVSGQFYRGENISVDVRN